ncbi:TetR/AcrR family transcriptional regulator [Candidatus Poribacteria bacterium]|nr:TetR/AcrR family transcriptional regulator [Candidatus Poribacteria bacterium]
MARQSMVTIRRAEITEALYRCIVKSGYANTSVRDIAHEASMRSGLIHHYFDSKDEILSALMKDIFNKYQRSFALLLEGHRDKPSNERLRLGIEFIFLKVAGDRDLIKVFHELWNLSQHNETLHESLRVLYRQYRKEVGKFIAECMGKTHGQTKDAKSIAALLVSASEGAGIQWHIDSRGISLSDLAKMSSRFVNMTIGRHGSQ